MLLKGLFMRVLPLKSLQHADKEVQLVDDEYPNDTLAQYNTPYLTTAVNATWFILPLDKEVVAEAVQPYKLLPRLPKAVFPHRIPIGKHPVIAQIGYKQNLTQFEEIQREQLMILELFVPFVDKLENGYWPFILPLNTWIGGLPPDERILKDYKDEKKTDRAIFSSQGHAYERTEKGSDEYETRAQKDIQDIGEQRLVDMIFTDTEDHFRYTNHTFHNLLNQPRIVSRDPECGCERQTIYFNGTNSNPTLRIGNVTLYEDLDLKGFSGIHEDAGGFSAVGQMIYYAEMPCKDAIKSVDVRAAA